MKTALLLLAAASAGAAGCVNNDISLSIVQMEAVNRAGSCMVMAGGTGAMVRARGLLDVANVTTTGYLAIPVVKNNLASLVNGGVQYNSVQILGANVKLTNAAGKGLPLPSAQTAFFYASAAGRIDPGATATMPVEVISAQSAKALAGMIPASGLFTILADVRPVGMRSSDQLVGGPIDFPIDLCNGCLTTTTMCPLPKGTVVSVPCPGFEQQDDPQTCCTDTSGALLCGAAAPVAM